MATLLSQEAVRIWARVVAEAWEDEELKGRLFRNPAAVLGENGLEVPETVNLAVRENVRSVDVELYFPPKPEEGRATLEDDDDPVSTTWTTF